MIKFSLLDRHSTIKINVYSNSTLCEAIMVMKKGRNRKREIRIMAEVIWTEQNVSLNSASSFSATIVQASVVSHIANKS